jgi:ubiquinone/menaquinone biosynthesis C-methylase UbiE
VVSFDRIAPHYRWLEAITFGNALQRARVFAIGKIASPRRAIIVGEGNGRFLREFVRAHPRTEIDCLDASDRMLEKARARLDSSSAQSRGRIRFLPQDIVSWSPEKGAYDLLVTHFFLDCFPPNDVKVIVDKLAGFAAADAVWLLADFAIPDRGFKRAHARAWLGAMYGFFRLTAGITANRLVDASFYLEANDFVCARRSVWRLGLLKSEIWCRNLTGSTLLLDGC